MPLMISLDDVIDVLDSEGVIEYEDQIEWFRSILEQKCYIIQKHKDAQWTDHIIGIIDEVMNVHSIAKHIENGTLKKWLESNKEIAMAELESLAKEISNG